MRQILTVLLLSVWAIAYAANPKPQLSETEPWEGYYYTYISSELLQVSPSLISDKDLRGFPMEKLKMAEICRSPFNGDNRRAKTLIESIVKNNDLTLLATSSQEIENEKTAWYAKYKGSGEKAVVEKFFVVKYTRFGSNLTMIYLEGEFTFADLKNFMK